MTDPAATPKPPRRWTRAFGLILAALILIPPLTVATHPAGLTGTFRLRLAFDSIDGVDNTRDGVFIDDLRVMAPCP